MMTKAERIKTLFDPWFDAPLAIWESFAEALQEKQFRKNDILKEHDQKEGFLHIITNGSAGLFLQREHQSICLDLCYENEFFCDYMSFLTQQPTGLYTQALEQLEVLSISHEALETLYQKSVIGIQIGRIAAESLFVHKQNQQIELLTRTAEERYRLLLEKQPKIIQRTASKHIASLLGITPESLSRIRKNSAG